VLSEKYFQQLKNIIKQATGNIYFRHKLQPMKNLLSLITTMLLCAVVLAQAPGKMSYQAVVRGSNNDLISNQQVGMRFNILQGSASGPSVYEETHAPTTNDNGLVSISIGGGTVINGNFSAINWANGPYFIQVETDPNGGTNYSVMGTSQLLSVPYALYAETSGTPGPQGDPGVDGQNGLSAYEVWLSLGNTGTEQDFINSLTGPEGLLPNGSDYGNTPYWDGNTWIINSGNIYNDGTNVGIGGYTMGNRLDVNGDIGIPAANDYRYFPDKTKYYSISPFAFSPYNSVAFHTNQISGTTYVMDGTQGFSAFLHAPVNLPDGARITDVTFYIVDNDSVYNPGNAYLFRNDASTATSYGNTSAIATIYPPSNTNSPLIQATTNPQIGYSPIDNANYSYYLVWETLQNDINIRLARVLITYTVQKVD
jgi:hypothetical protein